MQPPPDPPTSAQRWVSFDEARMILRMSEGTLRRAIRDGKVTAEQRRRNPDSPTDQRMIYEVLIMDPPTPATAPESPAANELATEPPAATTRALDIMEALLLANAASIGKLDDRIERLQAENAALRERVGRAETERERLLSELARARRSWWQRLLGRYPAP